MMSTECVKNGDKATPNYATLCHNLLSPRLNIRVEPRNETEEEEDEILPSEIDFHLLAKKFYELAEQRGSKQQIRDDIWTLVSLYVDYGENLRNVFEVATSDQRLVLLFYRFAPRGRDRLTLRNIGRIFPFVVCEYYQLYGSKRRVWVEPDEIAPNCPRFVAHNCFVHLIPNDPAYDSWFELFCRYRCLLSAALARKGFSGMSPRCQRAISVRDRKSNYLDEAERVFHLKHLCDIAGVRSLTLSPTIGLHFILNDSSVDISSKILCQTSTPLNSTLSDLSMDDSSFIEWASRLSPVKNISFKTPAKLKPMLLVYEGVNLSYLARVFAQKAKLRTDQQVSRDLSLMITHYMQRGPFLTFEDDNKDIEDVIRHYDLKNLPFGSRTLTLSRVAKIFPWLVCHYAEVYGPESDLPRPSNYPRYLAHQCFASLIPRHSDYHNLFELHLQCRIELDRVLRPERVNIADRLAKQTRFAEQARYSDYLSDQQRIHFLDQLQLLHHSRNSKDSVQ